MTKYFLDLRHKHLWYKSRERVPGMNSRFRRIYRCEDCGKTRKSRPNTVIDYLKAKRSRGRPQPNRSRRLKRIFHHNVRG